MSEDFLCLNDPPAAASSHTLEISHKSYKQLMRLREGDETDTEVLERALSCLDSYTIVADAMGTRFPEDLRKASVVARQMRGAGYTDQETVDVCRALFGEQQEKELKRAFKIFTRQGAAGTSRQCGNDMKPRFIDIADFTRVLPLMGENVGPEQIDALFDLVDVDSSGHIAFNEFCIMVKGLNPKGAQDDNPFEAFRNGIGESVSSMAKSTGSAISALSAAFSADLEGINPFLMHKAGTALNRLKEAGFQEEVAVHLCRAIFCQQTQKQLKKVFRFFDLDHSGVIEDSELRRALPLLGEDLSDEQVDQLFAAVDFHNSRRLDFDNFCKLIKSIHMP